MPKAEIPGLGREAPDYGIVRRTVDIVLRENSFREPPIFPKEIANTDGVEVLFGKFPASRAGLEIMGFYDPKARAIYVNRDDPPNRQTFTIAHELGHHYLHRDFILTHPDQYKVLYRKPMGRETDPIEKEANSFAANLLVPTEWLKRYYRIASVAEMARVFIVSEEVIRWRLITEKLTTEAA